MSGPLTSSIPAAIAALPPDVLNPPAQSQPVRQDGGWMHKLGLPLLIGGSALDTVSTLDALGRPNTREANPLARDHMALTLAIKAIANALAAYGLDKAHHRGKRWALPVAMGLGGLQAGAGVNNLRQGR